MIATTWLVRSSVRADVPFRLSDPRRPLLIVPVHVNGHGPFDFVLDTGASRTIVFDAVADATGLVRGQMVEGHGAGGPVRFALGEAAMISVGQVHAKAVPIVIGALDVLASHITPAPGGILGYSFLSRFRVVIDYPGSRFSLEG